MRKILICSLLAIASGVYGQTVSCPATRNGKKLTNAVFYEWLSNSPTRSMSLDRKALMPDESRVDGEDWVQSWDVSHAVEGKGLQMICQYQGLPAGLFIEVKDKVSACTLTKKDGSMAVECR